MKRFRTYLEEAFDRPYAWKQTYGFKGPMTKKAILDGDNRLQEFSFKDKTGARIDVEFAFWIGGRTGPNTLTCDVTFSIHAVGKLQLDLSGNQDAFRVMATVVDIMKTLAKSEVDVIMFSADKYDASAMDAPRTERKISGRARAYKALVKRFASKTGFTYSAKEESNYTSFRLIRK